MRSDSQLSVDRLKNALPYIFSTRAHRIIWAIGALVLFTTVPFLNSRFQAPANASYEKTAPVQPTGSVEPDSSSANERIGVSQDNSSTVRINDQLITVPSNGSIHKTVQSDDGQTKLDVSINSSSSSSQSSSSNNLQLNINSRQETTIDNSE